MNFERREARYYERLDDGKVACRLCPHECVIAPGRAGFCTQRRNEGGTLAAAAYGQVAAVQMDPIEKKPLYHFKPGSSILSIGANGCNFRCEWCQNWHLSESQAATQPASPQALVTTAQRRGSCGIAYTYNEPLINFEFLMDCAALAREAGLANVLVTNGSINPEPLAELLPLVDAMNIDLKSMDEAVYRRYIKGDLATVQHTIREAARACHVEVTNLVVPGVNDSQEQIAALIDFVAEVDRSTPLHFSRYHPQFKFHAPPTPERTLRMAYEMASEKLDYVFLGNIALPGTSDTRCPKCGRTLIERTGYFIRVVGLADQACAGCGFQPNIVW